MLSDLHRFCDNAMGIRFCKDCANFEERRDIDGVTMCKKNHGPYVCCEDFAFTAENKNENRLNYRFCSECLNFEEIDGLPMCAKHTPGVACEDFIERLEELNPIRQNNLIKTAFLAHTLTIPINPKPIPDYLIEAARKIRW